MMTRFHQMWAYVVFCGLVFVPGGAAGEEVDSAGRWTFGLEDFRPQKALKSSGVLDIVVVVDNSSSMTAEIDSLQDELYDHLVGPQIAAGVDVRVVVVSRHGELVAESVCFEAPLSSIPVGGCDPPPTLPGITNLFKQYSVEIGSHTAWCQFMDTFDGSVPDEFGLAPGGWVDWLREDAFKLILMVTDDGVSCGSYLDNNSAAGGIAAATAIDTDLLALSPLQFGSAASRTYIVHSLVGLSEYAVPGEPWPPTIPITELKCSNSIDPGTGHQGMSILAEGLRFPTCSSTQFDTFLEAVSQETFDLFPIFEDGFETGDFGAWSSVTQ